MFTKRRCEIAMTATMISQRCIHKKLGQKNTEKYMMLSAYSSPVTNPCVKEGRRSTRSSQEPSRRKVSVPTSLADVLFQPFSG
jgi:hypothetical protein